MTTPKTTFAGLAHMPEDNPRDKGISQRELEMVAVAMIEMFGDDAPNKAMSRAGEYQQRGEADGQDFWTRLAKVIQDALNRRSGSVRTE